jgi:glycosyltransferase involved in cell wall biosynthesis
MSLISIITPTFNEVANIEKLSLRIKEICELNNINYEQIIIDNDSKDGTIEIIKKLTTKYKNIKNNCINHLRTLNKMIDKYVYIENGGWHFNALGGIDKKIEDFKHPVYTLPYMKRREKNTFIEELNLPEFLIKNKETYKHLFK